MQIAGLIQLIEQVQRNHPIGLIGQISADLLDQVLAQGARPRRGLLNARQVVCGPRPVAAPPGMYIAAEVATDLGPAVALLARRGAPMIGRVRSIVGGQRLGKGLGGTVDRRWLSLRLGFLRRPVLAFAFAALEQRVLFDLGLDESGQLQVGQLQHLDRLLQLRCHHQSLALAQLKPLRKADSIHKGLRSERGL